MSKASEIEAPATTVQQPSTPRSMDIQSADAFNRLIASIRQSDKVKEQMQQRVRVQFLILWCLGFINTVDNLTLEK